MPKKRIFLDECCQDLKSSFAVKSHVYTAKELGLLGKEDTKVIDKAIEKRCLIVTVNKDFLDYYRDHAMRRQHRWGYGLIFLKPSKTLTKQEQLKRAIDDMAWKDTRDHDDLVMVSATGLTKHERLCHPACAAEFPKDETEWL